MRCATGLVHGATGLGGDAFEAKNSSIVKTVLFVVVAAGVFVVVLGRSDGVVLPVGTTAAAANE
jgi:hypothetical protein